MRKQTRTWTDKISKINLAGVALTVLTFAALVTVAGRLVAVGVVALGTGLFLLTEVVVGEGCLAELTSPLVERVDGRDVAEFGFIVPTSG